MTGLSFNKIVADRGSGFEEISVEDWNVLPLTVRMQIILEGKVQFFHDTEKVAVKDALLELKALALR